jgi:small nuclear ribonucleoprotein
LIKPLAVLNKSINQQVIVELKGKRGYRGILDGYDPHMNLVLRNVEETYESNVVRKMESTIVRGDNVIYISP